VALSKEEMRLIAGTLLGPRSLVPGVGERVHSAKKRCGSSRARYLGRGAWSLA